MTAEMIIKVNGKYPVLIVDMIEDDNEYKEIVLALLHKNGLYNIRTFDNPVEYDKALEENPNLTPQLALVDFKYDGYVLSGLHITDMLIQRSKRKSLRTKVIMITDYEYPTDIRKFFHMGGTAWFKKNEKDELISKINEVIIDILEALEEREWIDGLEDDIIK